MEALVLDPKTKEWSGELPPGTRTVYLQMLDTDGEWKPKRPVKPHPVGKIRKSMQETLDRGGPLKYDRYRLISAESSKPEPGSDPVFHQEETNMSKSKKSTKAAEPKAAAAKVEKKSGNGAEKVAGLFREGTFVAKGYKALASGKSKTIEEFSSAIGASSVKNANLIVQDLRKAGRKAGTFDVETTEDGKIKMTGSLLDGGSKQPKSKKQPSVSVE